MKLKWQFTLLSPWVCHVVHANYMLLRKCSSPVSHFTLNNSNCFLSLSHNASEMLCLNWRRDETDLFSPEENGLFSPPKSHY